VKQSAVKLVSIAALFIGLASATAEAQEAEYGISVPVTLSGDVAYRSGLQSQAAGQTSLTPGFRAVLSPTVRLGPHWFVYSNLEVRSSSYFTYETGADDQPDVQFNVMQAFVGYTTRVGNASLLVKAGQLSSAFGSFPLQYDDAKTAFPDPPPGYITNLPLRPDQLPCGVNDLLWQTYGSEVDFECGGAHTDAYGIFPVTLYGLPSVQAEVSLARIDARLQITNSSPANPHGFTSRSQVAQWTAGAGYTVPGGLHVGFSAFRGPYLDRTLDSLLPKGTTVRDFPASGVAIDAQWARGRWSIDGEWQRFQFDLPDFVRSPSERVDYIQLKTILSPRTFVAARTTLLDFGRVQDTSGISVNHFAAPQQAYEFAFGYRPNRHQLIKAGYEWVERNNPSINAGPQSGGSMFQVQLVTALTVFSRAFR
jgi:hypothetical protein